MSRALLAAALAALPVVAGAAAGGPYELGDASADAGGGQAAAGGAFSVHGVLGQAALPDGRSRGAAFELRRGFLDPPRLSLQGILAYSLEGPGGVVLDLPAGSVDRRSFEAAFRRDPAAAPLQVDPAILAAADEKMIRNRGPLARVNGVDVWETALQDETGWLDGALLAPAALSLPYRDADGNGLVDGTVPPVRVDTLELWRLDEANALWVKAPGARLDAAQKRVAAASSHLSVYALVGGADTAVAEVYAFPVPFRPNGPDKGTGPGKTGTEAAGITFANLPTEGTIDIYTLDGRLVRRLAIPPNLAPASLAWDVKNAAGGKVASGVYLWRAASGGNSKLGRLMVIR